MSEYHKIQSIFKRDMEHPKRPLILGEWTLPVFRELKDLKWNGWEKIDGTNIRVIYDADTKSVGFKGRTDNAQIPPHLLELLNEKFTFDKLRLFFDMDNSFVLYGEGTGYKIQKGCKYWGGRKVVDFILFDTLIEGKYWMPHDFNANAAMILGVPVAPLLDSMTLEDWVIQQTTGEKSHYGDFMMEGVVVRPPIELFDRLGNRVVVKIKHKDFLDK